LKSEKRNGGRGLILDRSFVLLWPILEYSIDSLREGNNKPIWEKNENKDKISDKVKKFNLKSNEKLLWDDSD